MSLLFFSSAPAGTITGTVAGTQAPPIVRASALTPSHGILQQVIPAYPYQQYADDENIVAFFSAFNTLAQGYLDWFNTTPLAVYTLPTIFGPLLDFIAQGIYGVTRPVFASTSTRYVAGLNALPLNAVAVNGKRYTQSGTATIATDDYYKRVITWQTYLGDGRRMSTALLRRRIARFLYGVNGGDCTLAQAQSIHIAAGPLPPPPAPTLSYTPGGSLSARTYGVRQTYVTPKGEGIAGAAASITVPANHLLVVNSPAYENGCTGYNDYVNVLSTNPGKFKAGVNAMAMNTFAVDGTNKAAVAPPTRQNATPLAIGSSWTEPASSLIHGTPLPTTDESNPAPNYIITVPSGTAGTYFQQAMAQQVLGFPFQLTASVVLR